MSMLPTQHARSSGRNGAWGVTLITSALAARNRCGNCAGGDFELIVRRNRGGCRIPPVPLIGTGRTDQSSARCGKRPGNAQERGGLAEQPGHRGGRPRRRRPAGLPRTGRSSSGCPRWRAPRTVQGRRAPHPADTGAAGLLETRPTPRVPASARPPPPRRPRRSRGLRPAHASRMPVLRELQRAAGETTTVSAHVTAAGSTSTRWSRPGNEDDGRGRPPASRCTRAAPAPASWPSCPTTETEAVLAGRMTPLTPRTIVDTSRSAAPAPRGPSGPASPHRTASARRAPARSPRRSSASTACVRAPSRSAVPPTASTPRHASGSCRS